MRHQGWPSPAAFGRWPTGEQVVVRLEGRQPAERLSRALRNGVAVRAIRPLADGALEVRLDAWELRRLRKATQGPGVRVRVVQRRGIRYDLALAARRPGLWLGGVVCAAGLVWSGTVVWAVRVEGTGPRLGRVVLAAVRTLGLEPGMARAAVHRAALASALVRRVPGVAWVGIEMDGGLVVVRALPERHGPPPVGAGTARLVAWHGGTVTRVVLTQGTATVQVGETVRAGQVLAEGYTVSGPPLQDGTPGPIRYLPPRGGVWARFTVRAQESVPAVQHVVAIGPWRTAWLVAVGSHVLTAHAVHGWDAAQGSRQMETRTFVRFAVPIPELGTVRAMVLQVRSREMRDVPLPPGPLLARALRAAEERVRDAAGPGAWVVRATREVREAKGRLSVTLREEVVANVARPDAGRTGTE